jgi:hypothetical protein
MLTEFAKQHLEESQRQILELADKIMLNKSDEESDTRHFKQLYRKIENTQLSEYLTDLANERYADLKIHINDQSVSELYKAQLTDFLKSTIKQRI